MDKADTADMTDGMNNNGNANGSTHQNDVSPINHLTDANDNIEHYDGDNSNYRDGGDAMSVVVYEKSKVATESSLDSSGSGAHAKSSGVVVAGATNDGQEVDTGGSSSDTESIVIRTQTDIDGDENEPPVGEEQPRKKFRFTNKLRTGASNVTTGPLNID